MRHAVSRQRRRDRLLRTVRAVVLDEADVLGDYPDHAPDHGERVRRFIERMAREAALLGLSVDRLVKLLRASVAPRRGRSPVVSLRDHASRILQAYAALRDAGMKADAAADQLAKDYRVSRRTVFTYVRRARRSARSLKK